MGQTARRTASARSVRLRPVCASLACLTLLLAFGPFALARPSKGNGTLDPRLQATRIAGRADPGRCAPPVRNAQEALAFAHARLKAAGAGALPCRLLAQTSYTSFPSGMHHYYFQAEAMGLAVFGGTVRVHTDPDGAVVSFSAPPGLFSSLPLRACESWITPAEALNAASGVIGRSRPPAGPIDADGLAASSGSILDPDGRMLGETSLRRVIFPDPAGPVPAWEVIMDHDGQPERTVLVLDAASGAVLYSRGLVHQVTSGYVFANGHPPMSDPVCMNVSPGSEQTFEAFEGQGGTVSPWAFEDETEGVNCRIEENLDGNVLTRGRTAVANISGEIWFYPFNDAFSRSCSTVDARQDLDAAMTNVFFITNQLHDRYDALGFDEASGNFQAINSTTFGQAGDPVLVMVQDPGKAQNASFFTPPDGYSPRMQLGLFRSPCRDSSFDSDLIVHEYAHGISDRLLGGECLEGPEGEALGEGWSDFFALSFNQDPVFSEYVTADCTKGLRRSSYDPALYPYDYGDVCGGGCNEHRDGEIWAASLWFADQLVSDELGDPQQAACLLEAIVVEGIRVTPCAPTMLDARDALYDAARVLAPGQVCTLASAFAKYGLGFSAVSTGEGSPGARVPAYDLPDGCENCDPGFPSEIKVEAPGDNTVRISWFEIPVGAEVEILKGRDGCGSGCDARSFTSLGNFRQSPYIDRDVSGGVTYSYKVRTVLDAFCSSEYTCISVEATGDCRLAPEYRDREGVSSALASSDSGCSLQLSWNEATSPCGTAPADIRYNIYRSEDFFFEPGPATLVKSVVGDIYETIDDEGLRSGTIFYYNVRAEDILAPGNGPNGGLEEANTVVLGAAPRGMPKGVTSLESDFDLISPPGWEVSSEPAGLPNGFEIMPLGPGGSLAYHVDNARASDYGAYFGVHHLVSPPFDPTAGSVMTFRHSFGTEDGFDGCVLEITTDGGLTYEDLVEHIASGGYNGRSQTLYYLLRQPNDEGELWTGTNPSGSNGFDTVAVDLSSYAWAEQARVRFRFLFDEATISGDGWTIDDIKITNVEEHWPCCGEGECIAPELSVLSSAPACPGTAVTFTVEPLYDGCGTFMYQLDFGDGTPPVEFWDLNTIQEHAYADARIYQARLTAYPDPFSPGCTAEFLLPVLIDDGGDPSGEVGNSLRLSPSNGQVLFTWSAVSPSYYNIHETGERRMLPDDGVSGIGAQPVIAIPSLTEQVLLTLQVPAGRISYYEVWGRNLCTGASYFP